MHELPDAGRTAKGLPIVNVINMQPDEIGDDDAADQGVFRKSSYLFFTTRLGQVKRTSLEPVRSRSVRPG